MINTIRTTFLAFAGALALLALTGAQPARAAGPLQGRVGVHGELTAIEDGTLTVQGRHGPVSVIVDEVTFIRIIGETDPGLDDLQVGDNVLARGMRQDDGSIQAAFVAREPDGDRSAGRVISVSEASLILSAPDGVRITVSVNAETIVAVGLHDTPWDDGGREAVHEGMPLFVYGESSDGGTNVEAHTLLAIRPLRFLKRRESPPVAGLVRSIERDQLFLISRSGLRLTVTVDEDTRYRVGRDTSATLDDFSVGHRVLVFGRLSQDGSDMQARLVARRQQSDVPGRANCP